MTRVTPDPSPGGTDASSAPLTIERFPTDRAADWNAYVDRAPGGSVWHKTAWDIVFAAYRLEVVRLWARRGDRIVGVLPLVRQHGWPLFVDQWVSLPWSDSAGVLADDTAAREALVSAALDEADRRGSRWVHLRQPEAVAGWTNLRSDKVLMRLALPKQPDALWKQLDAKVRNQIRKAEKSGLEVTAEGAEQVDVFYRIYSENMRDLGSPSHSPRFFAAAARAFGSQLRIHVVRCAQEVVGVGLTLHNGDRLEIPWASSLRKFGHLCVNHALYWHLLSLACREGYRWFHFGRSARDTGPYRFKAQWGAEPCPLYWYYLARRGDVSDALRPVEETHGRAVAIWRRLPLPLTRRLGPHLIARLP